ncbi:MAG TPA: hypothetical protein VGM19_04505 [Armatimonadota bacterium]
MKQQKTPGWLAEIREYWANLNERGADETSGATELRAETGAMSATPGRQETALSSSLVR